MPIDGIIILVLLGLVIFVFRKFSSFVYSVVIIDLFFRIVDYVLIKFKVDNILPKSIPAMMTKYINGTLYDFLEWVYVGIYAIFLGYIIIYFVNKRK